MKNSLKILAATTALFALPATASAATEAATAENAADHGWYMGGSAGLVWPRNAETGWGGNLALGYRFADWRLEAEGGYHGAGGDSGYRNIHYFTYMGNAYYDFNSAIPTSEEGLRVVPYIGAGLGGASVNRGSGSIRETYNHNNDTFAYQGMAGLSLASTTMPNVAWTIGYRYLGTEEHNLSAHNVEIGARIHF